MNSESRRAGFTMIEVLTALALTGFVAVIAHRLVSVTIESARSVAAARVSADRRENALRWLRAAFLSLEAGGAAGDFAGHEDRVSFSAWLEQPEGWLRRERVTLRLDGSRLSVETAAAGQIVLADSLTSLAFDYLLEPGANARWVRVWLSPLSAPLAIRVRWGHRENGQERGDTLLLLIKERG